MPAQTTKPLIELLSLELNQLPPSVNNAYATIYRGGKPIRIPSAEAVAFKNTVITLARLRGLDIPAKSRLCLTITFYFPASMINRRRDISNMVKLLEDALMEASTTPADDKQIYEIHLYKRLDDSGSIKGRTVVTLDALRG